MPTSLQIMGRLLVVHHAPTATTRALLDALLAGAHHEEITGTTVMDRSALETTADDLLAADGFLLLTPANLGYMSGAMKHMFDGTFLHIGGALSDDGSAGESDGGTSGRPFGLLVHGRYDTEGAVRSVVSIVQALRWRQAAEVVEILGDLTDEHRELAHDLGGTLSALVADA